ncbi:hypothetical protein ACFRI7_38260 [Streptomyces sp. NPDC056716]|uniref:hypothetical protein n=1 Tax=unclassified Streptomyces TaxID=2593676 RepID=UPI0036D07CB4
MTSTLRLRERVLLAAPRGRYAGAERAVGTVMQRLEMYGAPVHVGHENVHNVRSLEDNGTVVERADQVPEGSLVAFSPTIHAEAPDSASRSCLPSLPRRSTT